MKNPPVSILVFVLAITLLPAADEAAACTTFLLRDAKRFYVGKSYDYHIGYGMAVFNKRGVSKRALPVNPEFTPLSWKSRYASLTFNQFGREFPNGGMNEKGLVVEIMWLSESRYPAPDERPAISELQWIQYQLDNHATVAEVAEHAPGLLVVPVYGKVHYLVCDAGGACGAFEYLDGKLVVTTGDHLKAPTLTNNSYRESARALGKKGVPKGNGSLERFVRASRLAGKLARKPGDPVQEAFSILDSVDQGKFTRWNIVYDITAQTVHYRTRDHERIKRVRLDGFDPACKTPARVLDMNQDPAGDVTESFAEASHAANLELVKKSLKHIQQHLPPGAAQTLAGFPESFTCAP